MTRGRPYIANPDLVERLATGAPLAEVDWETVYESDHKAIPTIRLSVGRRPSELNSTKGLMNTRPINSVRNARKLGL